MYYQGYKRGLARKYPSRRLFISASILTLLTVSLVIALHQTYSRMLRVEERLENMILSINKRNSEANGRIVRNGKLGSKEHVIVKRNLGVSARSSRAGLVTGVVYVRWGRRDCPQKVGTSLVYHGYAAGSHYSHTGGGSDFLCLHNNVSYSEGHYVESNQASDFIYGVEYRDSTWSRSLFDTSNTENGALQHNSVPCAICLVKPSTSKLMIPARETCPDKWIKEYTGYIMSGGHSASKHSSSYLCVDDSPQVVPNTRGENGGSYLYLSEISCTSLPCEPFVSYREVRCVVCTLGQ